MTEQQETENPDEILDHTLNDDWMLLWYKALLLSDDYRSYCEAIASDNKSEIARLTGEYGNISDTYKYFGYIYDDVEVIENGDVIGYEPASFENAELGYDNWFDNNGHKLFQLTAKKAEIVREGFSLEPQAGTLYFCKLSVTNPELDAKLQDYLDDAVKNIERKLAKDRLQFTNRPISQLNPEIRSNQLDPTGRRLAAVHALSKQKELSEHYVRDAFIELLKNPPTRSWEVKHNDFLKEIKENDAYPDSFDGLSLSYLGDDYANFKTEGRTGLELIKNATNFIFPKC